MGSNNSLWNSGRKGADYQVMDEFISEWFDMSGTSIIVHRYLGVYGSDVDADGNLPDGTAASTAAQIEDITLMENRDRKYDRNLIDLRGTFQIPDYSMALLQFATTLSDSTLTIFLHLNDMLAMVGRKITAGDVLELPCMRDDAIVNTPGAANQYYVVHEAKHTPSGYQATWFRHIWQLKCEPMTASQEYADILAQPTQNPYGIDSGTLNSLVSETASMLSINEAVVKQAEDNFLLRNFETRHLYIVPGDNQQSAWVFTGDGVPPNGAVLSGSGGNWPEFPEDGDYYLRTDYQPHSLYRYENRAWRFQELDYRQTWSAASRLMLQFINNTATTTYTDGSTVPSKQSLYNTVKPRGDF